ncbi:hypothetical protein NDU88_000714 [Pleurodeles waltl]|uniref:Uncharacterized protein n=1 Tax=Pleurodeles waltl TaxID=8319 RepID=A0AAV7U4B6_PLEWA|nr:hypothetical protein NDU88_000714 [Pleurodeles waltl]
MKDGEPCIQSNPQEITASQIVELRFFVYIIYVSKQQGCTKVLSSTRHEEREGGIMRSTVSICQALESSGKEAYSVKYGRSSMMGKDDEFQLSVTHPHYVYCFEKLNYAAA